MAEDEYDLGDEDPTLQIDEKPYSLGPDVSEDQPLLFEKEELPEVHQQNDDPNDDDYDDGRYDDKPETWMGRVGNYIHDHTYGFVKRNAANIGGTLGGVVVGELIFPMGGAIPGALVGFIAGDIVSQAMRTPEPPGTELDAVLRYLHEGEYLELESSIKKISNNFNDTESEWNEKRLKILKSSMSGLYANLDKAIGTIDDVDAKQMVLKIDTALNYLEAQYLDLRIENPEIQEAEHISGYNFEQATESFKDMYRDVNEHPPPELISYIDKLNETEHSKGLGWAVNDMSSLLYTGRRDNAYHHWKERLGYMQNDMKLMEKELNQVIDEQGEKEGEKTYLTVNKALTTLREAYEGKRDHYIVQRAEKELDYVFKDNVVDYIHHYDDIFRDDDGPTAEERPGLLSRVLGYTG